MQYPIIALVLILLELLYFKLANQYNIIDKPNLRSSHTAITLRGGGIIFPLAMVLLFALGDASWSLTLAVVLVGALSFIDDIKPLSQLPRFGSHLIAVLLVCYDLNLTDYSLWFLPLVFVLLIGWINAFNFMDGINGITVSYALVAIISFSYLPVQEANLPILLTMGLSCLVFGFFNFRTKALAFAGDVGSISMALFLGYFMIKTIAETGEYAYILFFAVYGIDAVLTIVNRIRKKENIFDAHRSHLYQYLANEKRVPQLWVATAYALVQLGINVLTIILITQKQLTLFVLLLIISALSTVYLLIRYWATIERKAL